MIELFLFVTYAFFSPNSYDPGRTVSVPFSFAAYAFEQAALYDDVSAGELIGMGVTEHGSSGRGMKASSVGDDGDSRGLYQISLAEVNKYNKTKRAEACPYEEDECDYQPVRFLCTESLLEADPECRDLMDWRANTEVAAWLVHRHKEQHATKGYCVYCNERLARKGYCRSVEVEASEGPREFTFVQPVHTWVAHWKCGPKDREFKTGCEARRIRWIRHMERWDDTWLHSVLVRPESDDDLDVVELDAAN